MTPLAQKVLDFLPTIGATVLRLTVVESLTQDEINSLHLAIRELRGLGLVINHMVMNESSKQVDHYFKRIA